MSRLQKCIFQRGLCMQNTSERHTFRSMPNPIFCKRERERKKKRKRKKKDRNDLCCKCFTPIKTYIEPMESAGADSYLKSPFTKGCLLAHLRFQVDQDNILQHIHLEINHPTSSNNPVLKGDQTLHFFPLPH